MRSPSLLRSKNSLKIDGKTYDVIRPEAVEASKILADTWIRLGKPVDPFSVAGKKIVNLIIAIWEDTYPLQAHMWIEERKHYQSAEKTIHEQVSQKTGRSLASFPYPVYQMIIKTFKGFDPAERKNCMKFVKEWPIFRFANKV